MNNILMRPRGLHTPTLERAPLARWAAACGFAVALLVVVLVYPVLRVSGAGHSPAIHLLRGPSALGYFVGSAVGYALAKRLVPRWRARARGRAAAAVPLQRIAEAAPGRVRLEGTARVVNPVVSPTGQTCLAYDAHISRIGSVLEIQSDVGSFEIDDNSGARAIVRAEHVLFAGVKPAGSRWLVADGARLRIVGEASWAVVSDDTSADGGGPRNASQQLLISSTADAPLLLEVLDGV